MKKFVFIIPLVLLFTSSVLAETWYIKSYKVRPTTTAGGKVKLDLLKRGFQVEEVGSQKSWKKIRFNGISGWVHKFALSKKAPRKRISLLLKKVNISSKARKRASSFTSAAAARGLLDSEKSNLALLGEPDFVALSEMISLAVQTEEATLFVSKNE